MGRPVKILELAENMIRLSGYEPYRDIEIVETGLRPGEKLYEELLIASRNLEKTGNGMIFVEHQPPVTPEELGLLEQVAELPEHQRTVLHLHYWEGYALREIAALLGVTVPTVKMRLKRGRDTLRKTWEESL